MFAQNRVLSNAAFVSAVALATLAGTQLAMAQESKPADAQPAAANTAPAEVKPLDITVLSVSGKVSFKSSPDAALAELKTGQKLTESSEVFTAVGAIVQIKVGDGQVFTIDRLSRVLIKNAVNATSGKQTTELQLPYGRVRFDVVSTQVANDVKIQSPDATLAVKGTHGVMEKIPGQPTRAYGGELNAGVFNVMLNSGVNVDVAKNVKASSAKIQTADLADAGTFVQTDDKNSSDKTSQTGSRWTPMIPGASQNQRQIAGRYQKQFFPPITFPDGFTPINDSIYVGVGRTHGNTVSIADPNAGPSADIGHYLSGFRGTPQGAALVMTENGPSVVAIDDSAGPGFAAGTLAFRQWDLNATKWVELGTLAPLALWDNTHARYVFSSYVLDGLGNLDCTLYASGYNTPAFGNDPSRTLGHYGIFEMTYPEGNRSFSAQQVMSFPMLASGGGLTGANSRGSMFAASQWHLSRGTSPGGLVLLEVDPRTNYVVNAWSSVEGDFSTTNAQVLPAGTTIPAGFQTTGVAFANNQVVLSGTAGGRATTMTIALPRDGTREHPTVTSARVGLAGGAMASNALAGEGGFNAPASFPLGAAERKYTSVPGVDPLWLSTAYSRDAVNSRTFRRMVRDTVLSVANDPNACATSPELAGRLPTAIADHYNQRNGVNSAINQFYSTLPYNHPCRCNTTRPFGG